MPIFLEGLKLAKYRGIGPDWQVCDEFGTMNFFVGPNNAGKSGFLNYIANHIGRFGSDGWQNVALNDQYNRGSLGATEVMIPEPTSKIIDSIPVANNPNFGSQQQVGEKNRATLNALFARIYGDGTTRVWHHFLTGSHDALLSPAFNLSGSTSQSYGADIQLLWSSITKLGGASIDQWMRDINQFVSST